MSHSRKHGWNKANIIVITVAILDSLFLQLIFDSPFGRPGRMCMFDFNSLVRGFFLMDKTRRIRKILNNLIKSGRMLGHVSIAYDP